MTVHRIFVLGLCAALGCGPSHSVGQNSSSEISDRDGKAEPETPEPPPPALPIGLADAGIQARPSHVPDAAWPPLKIVAAPDAALTEEETILRPSKRWPFRQWDAAKSFTFNRHPPKSGSKLRVYSKSSGWTENPTAGPVLTRVQAERAVAMVGKTRGEMIVSKCPYPRHGIVFFQGKVPVASISVCFECGDIMVWPAFSQDPKWEKKKYHGFQKDLRAYDRVFPGWKRLFEKELGLPSDWTLLPKEH